MKVSEGLTTLNVCLCVFQVFMSAFVDLQLQLSTTAQQELHPGWYNRAEFLCRVETEFKTFHRYPNCTSGK